VRRWPARGLIAVGFFFALLAERCLLLGERIAPSRPQTRVRSFVEPESSIFGGEDTTDPRTALLDTLTRRRRAAPKTTPPRPTPTELP
jgi:hypothetical protein